MKLEGVEKSRKEYAIEQLEIGGIEIVNVDKVKVEFMFMGYRCKRFFWTGWHTGKSIKDGRGIHNLLKQVIK